MLMDFYDTRAAEGVPKLEEKCVKAIVGGIVQAYHTAQDKNDAGLLDAARRSLTQVHELLERLHSTSNDAWIYETSTYFNEQIGHDE